MKKRSSETRKESPRLALQRLEQAVQSMDLGLTITDIDGKILFTNSADALMHGYETGELIGQEARSFAPHAYWKPMAAENIQGMKNWSREVVNIRKDEIGRASCRERG